MHLFQVTGRPKAIAFATYSDEAICKKALVKAQNLKIKDKLVRVKIADKMYVAETFEDSNLKYKSKNRRERELYDNPRSNDRRNDFRGGRGGGRGRGRDNRDFRDNRENREHRDHRDHRDHNDIKDRDRDRE